MKQIAEIRVQPMNRMVQKNKEQEKNYFSSLKYYKRFSLLKEAE